MKGTTPLKSDKQLWNKMASIGCIACRKDGVFNSQVSIHHIDGRTKPGAHRLVLPLCAGHHQDGTGADGLIAVHPWKSRFEDRYGKQLALLEECMELIYEI
jgi:Recombination enhancement, RecA-dependent nuclease